jgi:hypothetical protein
MILLLASRNVAAQGESDDLGMLEAYNWYLVEAHTMKGEPLPVLTPAGMDPMKMQIRGHSLDVEGCNIRRESFDLRDQQLVQRNSNGYLVTRTLSGCVGAPARADDAMLILFNGNPRYQLLPSSSKAGERYLALESPADMIAVFRGEATAETRYGSKGETIWFDIAPRTLRCSASGRTDCDCLQVREVFSLRDSGRYSDDTTAEGAGPWQLLCDGIEGLDARADFGNGQYFPLKRFRRETPAGGTASAYVVLGR